MKLLAWGIIGAAILGVASGMQKGSLQRFTKNFSGKLNMQGAQQMMQSAQQIMQGAQQMMQPFQQAGQSTQASQQMGQSTQAFQQASQSTQPFTQQAKQSSEQPIPQHNQQMNQSSK
ncbi:MAG: hypothetical protein ACI33P_06635 [Lysinibacillus sp.]